MLCARIARAAALLAVAGCAVLSPPRRPQHHAAFATPGGVRVQDLIVPAGGPIAGPTSLVTLHYSMWSTAGEKLDSSYDRGEPVEFRLGQGAVPRGLEEGLLGMRRGGHRTLVVPPELGYGADGGGGLIPPNSRLVLRIELIEAQ